MQFLAHQNLWIAQRKNTWRWELSRWLLTLSVRVCRSSQTLANP